MIPVAGAHNSNLDPKTLPGSRGWQVGKQCSIIWEPINLLCMMLWFLSNSECHAGSVTQNKTWIISTLTYFISRHSHYCLLLYISMTAFYLLVNIKLAIYNGNSVLKQSEHTWPKYILQVEGELICTLEQHLAKLLLS